MTHVLRCCRDSVGGVGAETKHIFASDCSTKYDVDSRVYGVYVTP